MLTPLDIHNKEFGRSLRGYNEDEVNEFLDRVIKDYEALVRENRLLEEKVASLEERLQHFQNLEDTLSKSIIIAQETGEEVKANARKEAQLIVKEAEKNADRIVNESLVKSRKMAMEIDEIQKQASVYRARFRSLVSAQLELLESEQWNHLLDEKTIRLEE
ncbi:DivIVA domain-containing protein [Tumebacillus permanentifrigoris]|uniref:Cell division initiation protein n=1 Tax=Tumebacillus permanentifrigoris TaxID=378543 RepID=A0A316D459_9BACL|nr:DivIVA domain-containing protein [Tumebacillus permanentifrigoris]PWK04955.1 cell division initiation protein [Tumebacillus permanentifrigoris]